MYGFFISFHFSFSWKLIFWDNVTWLSFGKLEGCVNSQPIRIAFNWVMWEIHSFECPHKSLCWFDWHNVWFFHQFCMEILTVILHLNLKVYFDFQKNDNLIKMCFLCGVILCFKGWKWLQSTNTLYLFWTSECLFLPKDWFDLIICISSQYVICLLIFKLSQHILIMKSFRK